MVENDSDEMVNYKIALGGNAESMMLKSEGDGQYQGEERDPNRFGAADWWVRLNKPASHYKGGYGNCCKCGKPVDKGGFDKYQNVDGTFCEEKTLLCGKPPCVVLS